MKTHRCTLHAGGHRRTVPAKGITAAQRADALNRAGRGVAILAIVLATLGGEAAATSAQASADHASAHHPAETRLGHMTARPWMY